jgi:hypothetical protein
LEALADCIVVGTGAETNNSHRGHGAAYPMDGLKAIHQRHSDLSENEIRMKSLSGFNKAASVTNGADNFEFAG